MVTNYIRNNEELIKNNASDTIVISMAIIGLVLVLIGTMLEAKAAPLYLSFALILDCIIGFSLWILNENSK